MNSRAFTDEATVPSSDEENIFRAATGLPFRCAMCGREHRHGSTSLKKCIQRLVYITHFQSNWWKPNLDDPTVLVMQQEISMTHLRVNPMRDLFVAMHQSLYEEYHRRIDALMQRSNYTRTEMVPVMEALGAPNAKKYLDERYKRFLKDGEMIRERILEEHRSSMKDLADRFDNLRNIPPEMFRVEKVKVNNDGGITELLLNGRIISDSSILCEFTSHIPSESCLSTGNILYKMFLVNSTPAISWGIKRHGVRFLTLLTGKTFLDLSGKDLEGHDIDRLIKYRELIELKI